MKRKKKIEALCLKDKVDWVLYWKGTKAESTK